MNLQHGLSTLSVQIGPDETQKPGKPCRLSEGVYFMENQFHMLVKHTANFMERGTA